jgi:hypothetical protein
MHHGDTTLIEGVPFFPFQFFVMRTMNGRSVEEVLRQESSSDPTKNQRSELHALGQ